MECVVLGLTAFCLGFYMLLRFPCRALDNAEKVKACLEHSADHSGSGDSMLCILCIFVSGNAATHPIDLCE